MTQLRRKPARGCGRRSVPACGLAAAVTLVVVLAFSVGLAGCGASGSSTTASVPASTEAPTTSGATTTSGPSSTAAPTSSSEAVTTTVSPVKLDKLTLVAPPGPMAIPLAYIAMNNKLADVAEQTEVVVWENQDQLKAYVAGGQGDFVTMPSNTAAVFYNKGLPLQLLDISVWNITYLMTADPTAASFADIKGQSLAIPFEGSVPDLMFQYIAKAEGLDPQKDFDIRYTPDPTQAAQLLLSGQVQNAVLSEALATAAELQTKTAAKPLHRALAFDEAWAEASGEAASPIAGTVATTSVLDKPEVVRAFIREYKAAVQWMLDNPEEAGRLMETQLPQLGLKAPVMTAALQNITWDYIPATDARVSLEEFYQALSELSPDVIGGKFPDDGFYFNNTP
jgi:NitT/TauT family transport system substrate-binding protein